MYTINNNNEIIPGDNSSFSRPSVVPPPTKQIGKAIPMKSTENFAVDKKTYMIIIGVVVVLLLLGGGYFWYSKQKKTKPSLGFYRFA